MKVYTLFLFISVRELVMRMVRRENSILIHISRSSATSTSDMLGCYLSSDELTFSRIPEGSEKYADWKTLSREVLLNGCGRKPKTNENIG